MNLVSVRAVDAVRVDTVVQLAARTVGNETVSSCEFDQRRGVERRSKQSFAKWRRPAAFETATDERENAGQSGLEAVVREQLEAAISPEQVTRLAVEIAATSGMIPAWRKCVVDGTEGGSRPDVLDEAKLAAGAQNAGNLVECALVVGDRTEDKGGDNRVERVVVVREILRARVGQRNVGGAFARPLDGLLAHVVVRFDGLYGHVSREVREHCTGSRSDIQHGSRESVGEILAVLGENETLWNCHHWIVEVRKQPVTGIAHRLALCRPTVGCCGLGVTFKQI
jgi:hypothetical protein